MRIQGSIDVRATAIDEYYIEPLVWMAKHGLLTEAELEQVEADAERSRKARLAKRTVPCSAPDCEVPVAQDGETPAELHYCPDHRDRFRPHRRRDVKGGECSRWVRSQDRRLPVMP